MTHLEIELATIKRELLLGMNRARNALVLASEAILEQSEKKAERARAAAKEIDYFRVELEDKCLATLSRFQLVAGDARFVAFVLGSLTDLERSGDYAAHIADDALLFRGQLGKLHQLFVRLVSMLERLSLALERQDAALANAVAGEDAHVDELIEATSRHVVAEFNQHPLESSLASLRVLRSVQRIGDHIENIAQRLEFAIVGKRAKSV